MVPEREQLTRKYGPPANRRLKLTPHTLSGRCQRAVRARLAAASSSPNQRVQVATGFAKDFEQLRGVAKDLTKAERVRALAPRAPGFLRGSLYRGTRRDRVKDLAQSTALVNGLDDVVRCTRLWAKLYAR